MRSSSTDRRERPPAGAGPRPAAAGAWLRLALVGLLGVAALVAPSAVGRTGAIYTDSQSVGFTVLPSSAPATPVPTTSPTSDPTATAAAPALVAAPAGPATPTPSDAPTADPTPQPSATATPLQAPMLPATGRWHPRSGR